MISNLTDRHNFREVVMVHATSNKKVYRDCYMIHKLVRWENELMKLFPKTEVLTKIFDRESKDPVMEGLEHIWFLLAIQNPSL